MKHLLIGALALFCLGATQCTSIPYEADIGFLNSAQANSHEWPVRVADALCADMEGLPGACTKRVLSNAPVKLSHDARPYGYRIDVRCTAATGVGFSMDVPPNAVWEYELTPDKFQALRSFTCQGEVFPEDRDNSLSAIWQIRFLVVDQAYKARETPYISGSSDDQILVVGKNAKYATFCVEDECEMKREKTTIEFSQGMIAYSESEVMRFNYFRWR